ncbi:MAG: porin family protein [Rhizobiaceae bacterium]|nr:porin family protein [Rhizobiaceae bacterium]
MSSVLLAMMCVPSFAGDALDPSEDAPVKPFTGIYVRADALYSLSMPTFTFDLADADVSEGKFGGGIGIGYQFNDWLRADLTGNYIGKSSYDLDIGFASISAEHQVLSGMLTGYAELGHIAGFTPYLGFGAGVARITDSTTTSFGAGDFELKQTDFAYNIVGGASYRLNDKVTLDAGYQFFAVPSALNVLDEEFSHGIEHHQVKVGLRYNLW